MTQEEKKDKKKKKAALPKGAARPLGYGLLVLFLMVWVFILGIVTGRGDVQYFIQRLGLYKSNLAARLGIAPSNQVTGVLPLPQGGEDHKAVAIGEKKPGQQSVTVEATPTAVPPPAKPTEVMASKAAAETSKKPEALNPEEKKPKSSSPQKSEPSHSVASKLSFQNSLDTPTRKQPKTVAKKEGQAHTASIVPSSSPAAADPNVGEEKKKAASAYQVRVGWYRTTEEAEKTMADLKKKGFNVTLQKGKDKAGAIYIIKTGRYNNKAEAEKVTRKLKEANLSGQIQELP